MEIARRICVEKVLVKLEETMTQVKSGLCRVGMNMRGDLTEKEVRTS